jgi:hypothetical protein
MQETKDIIVDAVITWVDGNDPIHKAKMQRYLGNTNSISNSFFRTLFDQVNEIEFCVKSILKYAKYVRNIYIVTDNQIPDFLKDTEKAKKDFPNVSIVDHKVIFEGYERYLPTFNSLPIETLLHRIPGLSEHYVSFNDDFFLINETSPSVFFRDGFPVLRGEWFKQDNIISFKKIVKNKKDKYTFLFRKAKEKSSKLIGFDKSFNVHHTPYPLRKSTLEKYFKENENVLIENIQYKFRHINQYLPQSLANHIELKNNTCIQEKDTSIVYIHSYTLFKMFKKFSRASIDKKRLFMCLQGLDQCSKWKLTFVKNWLQKKYY